MVSRLATESNRLTALKTLTLRLRGSKTELEEMGEDVADMATTTSQLQAKLLALTGGQVDIMLDENTFKNSTQILREMADAWEDMNDIQRASALELMGGKRQANVLSALIQNFDTVEKAIEASAKSSGSALRENEVWLDSIEGKVSQFNNAMQAMWSNFLDADVVKGFVALGTEIIKIIDKIGLLNSLILAFAGSKLIPWLLTSVTGMNTFGESLKYIGMMMTSVNGTGAALIPTIVAQTKALWAGSAGANVFSLSLKTVGIALKTLMSTPLGWFLAIGAAIFAIVKIVDAVTTTTEEHTEKLNELKSALQDTQSELDSVNQELQTTKERMAELIAMPSLSFVEQEELNKLKEENEELERRERLLKAQEEREKKRIAEQAIETVESQLSDTSYTGSVWDAVAVGIEGALAGAAAGAGIMAITGPGALVGAIAGAIGGAAGAVGGELLVNRISTEDKLDQEIERYKELAQQKEDLEKKLETASDEGTGLFGWGKSEYEKTNEELEKIKQELGETETYIDGVIKQMGANLDGVEYGYGADEILSLYDNLQYEFEIARGTIGAESDAIANIFNRPEYESTYNEIKRLQGELEKDPGNQTYLEQISEQCKKAEEDLIAVGLSADKAFDYFTMKSDSSMDDIMAQYKVAKTVLEDLKSGAINIDDLVKYDEEKGEATGRPDAIAEKLQGVAPEVREQFTSIVEAIKEGSYDTEDGLTNWDAAIKKIELQGMQAVIANVKTELEAANKLAFPDLEISGWIDSVEELRSAFESLSSAMDLIVTAQEQMNSSGRISMKTALDLMATTDDWNQILEVNNGVITMNANAEQILIQSKLDLIKANIEMALQQVETDIALMEGAINSTKAGNAFTQGFTKALTNAQGVLVGLKAGWDAFWAGEDVSTAFNSAYKSTVDNLTPDESSLGELYARRDQLQKQREMLTSVDTTQEFKNNYDFNKTPGDKYGEDEDSKTEEALDAFQTEMDYWENRIGANQAKYEQLQNEIDLLESKGQRADASFYEEQIKLENERLWLLEQQKSAAEAHLATFAEGSEEWWEVANTLNDIEGELDDVTASIVDLQDAIGELDTYKFEEFNSRLDDITSKLGTIRDLIAPDGEDWFNDQGEWTEEGVAVLGTYIQELETYKQGLDEAEDAYANYVKEYAGNEKDYAKLGIHSEQELYDKRQELIEQQYDYAQSISDTEQSVVDMYESNIDAVEEYTETLIDSYNDYIDSVKEALDAERDLYDFKKNVQKQSKDIAAIERRIASLSGSTNASDVAERRKLEAQLYESRESLNDTYIDHARTTQDEALDAEQVAYEESMNKFVEGLRTSLETATMNMDEFLMGVTSMVMYNADTVLTKYQETNLPLTDELTNPWIKAKEAVGTYSGDALALMNKWTEEGGFFAQFNATGTKNLQSPWSAGSTAADAFKTSVSTTMEQVVTNIESNIKKAKASLASLTDVIQTTAVYADGTIGESYSGNSGSGNSGGDTGGSPTSTPKQVAPKKAPAPARKSTPTRPKFKKVGDLWSGVGHTGVSIGKKTYNKALEIEGADAIYYPYTNGNGYQGYIRKGEGYTVLSNGKMDIQSFKPIYQKYAKGTTGTPRDEWALTDEPQFGDELVLVPGKDGNLSFVRKGTGIVPADLTQKLFELAQIPTSDLMNKNLTAIVPNITKNDFKNEFNFESLVHVDTVDSDTLPKLEKMVDKKIDDFSKALNYSLKRFAR